MTISREESPGGAIGAVTAALRECPTVRRVRVVATAGTADGLTAYVQPSGDAEAGQTGEAEQLARWRALWSDTYSRAAEPTAPRLDLSGWISSYTGRPIPEREMRDWLDATVERIAALAPRRLAEVGCGTGLILARLAPRCEASWASDFSAPALAAARRALGGGPAVTLLEQPAHDLTGLPVGGLDTFVLNSVVQYFPDLGYFARVLAAIGSIAAPAARIFIGDVRSLPLLPVLHASVLLRQADDAAPLADLRAQLAHNLRHERELVLAPAFFQALAGASDGAAAPGRVVEVEMQLKRGRFRNELTRFRYDVVLRLAGGAPAAPPPERVLDWSAAGLTPASLARLLAESAPASLLVTGVPDARLVDEVRAWELLEAGRPGLATVADLQAALRGLAPPSVPGPPGPAAPARPGVEPEDLWALGRDLPYRVEVRPSAASLDAFDVVLRHREAAPAPAAAAAAAGVAGAGAPHANRPQQAALANQLCEELSRFLAERLPAAPRVRFAVVEWLECDERR